MAGIHYEDLVYDVKNRSPYTMLELLCAATLQAATQNEQEYGGHYEFGPKLDGRTVQLNSAAALMTKFLRNHFHELSV